MKMPWLLIAGLLGAAAVVMGAAGAHLSGEGDAFRRFYQTAFTYHMFHVFALIAVAFIVTLPGKAALFGHIAGGFFLAGIILFSGSLYSLGLTGVPAGFYITPIGGLCLIAGWLSLAISGYFKWRQDREHAKR